MANGECLMFMLNRNMFRIEIMYVCYIAMKIYVFGCTIIFSSFYCLCITSMSHHFPTMNHTQTTPKPFKTKSSNFFTILFYQALHLYNNFVTSECVFQGHKHPLIYHPKGNYSKNYLSHGSSCGFT
jgi:hypothetical protein